MARGLILIVDTSGSMSANAAASDGDGDNITALQLVGHAARTCLQAVFKKVPEATVALISFSSDVSVVVRPTVMSHEAVDRACSTVDLLSPDGVTNMWGAISSALQMSAQMVKDNGCTEVDIFLFTDGLPTERTNPRAGIVAELKNTYPNGVPKTCIHTFGFGPNIDSDLLLGISTVGHGIFKYVSDPGMVGTALINSIAKFILDSRMNLNNANAETHPVPFLAELIKASVAHKAGTSLEPLRKLLNESLGAVGGSHPVNLDREQLSIALSQEEFLTTWGLHYFRTLLSSHTHRHCGNFKDQGLQPYASVDFADLQDEIQDIFKTIAPPQGSEIKTMDAYVNPMGGCWSVDCKVTMGDGKSTKRAGDIRVGDFISCNNNPVRVDLIMVNHNPKDLVQIGSTVITSWHPIRYNGSWIFAGSHPSAMIAPSTSYSSVVSFMLQNPALNHSITVEGIECIGLAHQQQGEVVAHDLYGTEKIVDYLKQVAGEIY